MPLTKSLTTAPRLLRWFFQIGLVAIRLFVASVLIWSILRFYPGESIDLVRIGNYMAPWLWLSLLPVLVISILTRQTGLALLSSGLFLVWATVHGVLFSPRQSVPPPQSDPLIVMTFNVHYANRNVDEIVALIERESPAIIAFQELVDELGIPLREALHETYPYEMNNATQSGLQVSTFSRYPLYPEPMPPDAWRAQKLRVEAPQGSFTMWNIHLPTPLYFPPQRKQANILAADIARTPGPKLVLGDLNTTPQSQTHQKFTQHLQDTHQLAGHGFGFTYPNIPGYYLARNSGLLNNPVGRLLPPLIRIDHILVSDAFTVLSSRVIDGHFGSDHKPVIASLDFTSP